MKLKCTNKKCKYEWEYKGDHNFYATCPRCLRKVAVPEKSEEVEDVFADDV